MENLVIDYPPQESPNPSYSSRWRATQDITTSFVSVLLTAFCPEARACKPLAVCPRSVTLLFPRSPGSY